MSQRRRKRHAVLCALAGAGWLLWAQPAPAAGGEGERIVASIPPVHSLLSGVMKGAGMPRLLMTGGASPHAFALKPSDARALNRARAVFWIGPGLEGFLLKPISALPGRVRVVELAGDEKDADPHIWLDPANAAAMVRTMVTVLANIDPANAVLYRRNGSNLLVGLADLEDDIRRILEPVKGVPYLVFHDAYGGFGARFGLAQAGAVSITPARPPGPRRLRELRRRIIEGKIACVFTEPQFRPALAKMLIDGTDARLGELDPLGLDLPPGPGLYRMLMKRMARSLAGCLAAGAG